MNGSVRLLGWRGGGEDDGGEEVSGSCVCFSAEHISLIPVVSFHSSWSHNGLFALPPNTSVLINAFVSSVLDISHILGSLYVCLCTQYAESAIQV